MIKSMTGYGRAEVSDENYRVTVEMKSVNNRYLDIGIKMPRQLSQLEARIRKELKQFIQRGKVDVFITLEDLTQANVSIKYNGRIVQEVTIYADKVSVDEELVRLRSHIDATRKALEGNEGIGRKLDFIAQEMNRESNTILSKSGDLDISDRAINLKTTVEKVREQIQNIE